MPFLSGYTLRKKYTVNHTKVGSTLTDFPCVLKLAADSVVGANIDSNGYNFRITSSDGTTTLPYERKNFANPGSACTVQLYFKAPSLSSSVDTDFYLYYKSASPSDGADPTNVWDSNFKAVYHLEETPTGSAGDVLDSTSNANHGTSAGSMNSGNQVTGVAGEGLSFNGTSQTIALPQGIGSYPITIEGWFKTTTTTGELAICGANVGGDSGIHLGLYNDNAQNLTYQSGTLDRLTSGAAYSSGVAYQAAAVWVSATERYVYLNGVQSGGTGRTNFASVPTNNDTMQIAAVKYAGSLGNWMPGSLDEVRISNVARSADWIAATYSNLLDYSNFATLGSEESGGGGGATVTPGVASLTLTKFAPTVIAATTVKPSTLALTLTKFAPVVATPRVITPGKLSLVLTEFAPTVLTPRIVTPGTIALSLTEYAPTVATPRLVTPGTLALTTTRYAPTVLTPRVVTPGKLSLTLTEFAPTVTASGSAVVTPGLLALVITRYAPTVLVGGTVVVSPGGIFRRFSGLSRIFTRKAGRIFKRAPAGRVFKGYPRMSILVTKIPTDTSETRAYIFDFSQCDEAKAGETLVSATVPAVSGVTIGTPAVLATETNFVPAGLGVQVTLTVAAASTYDVECHGTFSGGAIVVVKGELVGE